MALTHRMIPWSRGCRNDVVFGDKNSTLTFLSSKQTDSGWPRALSIISKPLNGNNFRLKYFSTSGRKQLLNQSTDIMAVTQALLLCCPAALPHNVKVNLSFEDLKPFACFVCECMFESTSSSRTIRFHRKHLFWKIS